MASTRSLGLAAFGVFIIAALGLAGPATAKTHKAAPSCSAINFRPVASGLADGDHQAGQYRSRFAKIVLMARVKGGRATDYYMVFNGKRPAALKGVPAGVDHCLRAKHVRVPVKSAGAACTGSRFRVVVDHAGGRKTAMLFGLRGKEWRLCHAARV